MINLRAKLKNWDSLGPFRSIDDLDREMETEAHKWGALAASKLAKALVELELADDPLIDVLVEFLDIYCKHYPNALGEALLQELRPDGPPRLVMQIGCTGNVEAITRLKQIINLEMAGDELLVSLACALGDLGGSEALTILNSLQQRQNLSNEVKNEIDIALQNLAQKAQTH
jgi:hypothetical protein